MSEAVTDDRGLLQMVLEPSATSARWFVGLGAWGLLLAVLNILHLAHPTQRISWAGVLTMGELNKAFEPQETASAFVASDAVFMALCGGALFLGLRSIAKEDGGVEQFLKSLLSNRTWKALSSTKDGATMTMAAWSLLVGLLFYLVWGLRYSGWFDPGVYSVSAILVAFGFGLRFYSLADEGRRQAATSERSMAAVGNSSFATLSRAEQKAARRAEAKAKALAKAEASKAVSAPALPVEEE